MKQEKKMQKNLFRKENGNKGFSLVELIIVMAIMAILTGIVGTQVVPYINKAKEAKDLQIISAFGTAAVSAYTFHAEEFPADKVTIVIGTANGVSESSKGVETTWKSEISTLTGYTDINAVKNAMTSDLKTTLTGIAIVFDPAAGTITANAYDASGTVLEPVTSFIGATATPGAGG